MIKRLLLVPLFLLANTAVQAADDIYTVRQKFIGEYELGSYFTFPSGGGKRDLD